MTKKDVFIPRNATMLYWILQQNGACILFGTMLNSFSTSHHGIWNDLDKYGLFRIKLWRIIMTGKQRVLYRKQLEWLSLTRERIQDGDFQGYISSLRDSVQDLFYENNNLKYELWSIIPVEHLAKIRTTMDVLKQMYGGDGTIINSNRTSMNTEQTLENIIFIESIIKKHLNDASFFTVFYSWQSDSNKKYNRSFIENTLSGAIRAVNSVSTDLKLSLDKDTRGKTGAPDIVNVILQKIDSAIAFVADITPITVINNKGVSNPNVMCELGYALSSMSDERVILLCNTAYGELRDLPFDLGLKRVISYHLNENTQREDKSKIKKEIKERLMEELRAIRDL